MTSIRTLHISRDRNFGANTNPNRGNKDGQVVAFSHGWPLNSDNWDSQMYFFASKGYRVIAHDRRGHGRSSQPWEGNDLETWTDDVNQLFEHLDLQNVTFIGHSTGGTEVTRYVGKFGTSRVKKAVLISATPPTMLKTETYPEGLPLSVFETYRASILKDRAQFFIDVPTGPFFGYNRPNAVVSKGLIDSWFQAGMMCSIKAAHDTTYSWHTDLTEDLKKMNIPVLILHGDDDQIVPFKAAAKVSVNILPQGTLKVYPGGAHALPNLNADEVNNDLLEFIQK